MREPLARIQLTRVYTYILNMLNIQTDEMPAATASFKLGRLQDLLSDIGLKVWLPCEGTGGDIPENVHVFAANRDINSEPAYQELLTIPYGSSCNHSSVNKSGMVAGSLGRNVERWTRTLRKTQQPHFSHGL